MRRDDGSLLISGDMAADEFAEFTGIPLPKDRSYHTVAGFILERFKLTKRWAIASTFMAGALRLSI